MATVPRVTRRVFTNELPAVRKTAAETALSMGAGVEEAKQRQGAAIAQFGEQLGRVGGMFGEMAVREREKADETAVLEADNQLSAWEAKALYDPQAGALNRRGKDAQGIPEAVGADFEKTADAVAATLQPGRQQEAFAKVRLRRQANLEMTLRRHQLGEMQRYEVGELQAFVENKRDTAIVNALDPRRVNDELGQAVEAIKSQGPRLGMTPSQVEQQIAGVRADTYVGAIESLLAKDQVTAARAYYEETKDQINGVARARVEKALKVGTIREEAQDATEAILAKHPDDLAAQRKAAKDIENRDVRDEVLQRIEHEDAVRQRLENDEHEKMTTDAKNTIDATGDWHKIPSSTWSKLTVGESSALKAYAEHRVRKVPVDTVPSVYYDLVRKATSDDPKVRNEFYDPKQTNLLELVDKLSEADWQMFVKLQTTGAGQLEKEQHALLVNAANQNRIVDEAIVGMGFDPRPPDPGTKNFKAEDVQFVNDFRRQVRERVQALEQSRAGKGALATATDDEVQAIVDRMRIPIGKSSRMTYDNWGPWNTYGEKFAWEVKTFEDIPRPIVEEIKKAIYAKGDQASKELILDMYRARLSGLK